MQTVAAALVVFLEDPFQRPVVFLLWLLAQAVQQLVMLLLSMDLKVLILV
jgi:hypothetical protein